MGINLVQYNVLNIRIKFLFLGCIILSTISCRKKTYQPYIGSYACEINYHEDSIGSPFKQDSSYTAIADIIERDGKNMQFRDLPIPYKYILKNGEYKTGHFVPGIYWGREIILRNDSLYYFHYEGTGDRFWSIRYAGKRLD